MTAVVSQWIAGSRVTMFSPGVIKSWVKALDTGPAERVLKCRGHSARGIYGLRSISSDLKRLWLTAERVEMGFSIAVGKPDKAIPLRSFLLGLLTRGLTLSYTHTHCFSVGVKDSSICLFQDGIRPYSGALGPIFLTQCEPFFNNWILSWNRLIFNSNYLNLYIELNLRDYNAFLISQLVFFILWEL